MALTSGSVTIKLAGGTYSNWAAFWDDLGNLTGNITCTVDASAFTENVAPGTLTETLGGYTLHILPASFPTKTDASDGARFTCNHGDIVLIMGLEGAGDVIIEGMVIIEGTSEPQAFQITSIITEYNLTLRRNIVKGCSYGINHIDGTNNAGTKIYNNIILDSDYGIQINNDIASALIANNTIVDAAPYGMAAGDEEVTFKNNLVYSSGTADFFDIEVLTNGSNNAESDGTGADGDWGGTGTNNLTSIGDPFNNLAADDFSITAEGVIGRAGKDLSGEGITTDFFGNARHPTTPTIGACELPLAGAAAAMTTNTDFWGPTV